MGAYGSLSRGYDPGYLLRESSKGAEGYYLSAVGEIREPPGLWTGRAGPTLGLAAGAEVDPAVMQAVYGELMDPRDPAFADMAVPPADKAHLGPAPRRYKSAAEIEADLLAREPDATPERAEQLKVAARKQARAAVMFFDFTFSADKSTSVLHASLQAAALHAEQLGRPAEAAHYAGLAGEVEDAVRAGAAAAVEYLQDEAGYSRAGYHGAVPRDEQGRPLADHPTGRYVDAHEWVVASFLQHTSRDGDPQLHVHNAVLNWVPCADGTWRTIDSRGLHKARAAASAVGGRVMDEQIGRRLGAAYAQRPDLHGRELTGVPQAVKDLFSSRRAAITAGVADLAAQYEQRHGRPPSPRALFSMAQYVTLDSRRAKPRREHAVPRAVTLAGWQAEMRAAELGALASIPAQVIASLDPGTAPGIEALGEADLRRIIGAAVAEVQAARAVWGRPQLLAAIDAQLPDWLGGLDPAGVRGLLDELTDQALASGEHGVVCLEAPELTATPPVLRRADGRSVYSPHDRALYTTRPQLDAEEQLLAAAAASGGPAADADDAAAALGATAAELAALPGWARPGDPDGRPAPATPGLRWADGLRDDQAAAVYGILTDGRPVDVLIGPAGTGKSRTMGTLSHLWRHLTGGTVIGVATAENAAQVLAAEGIGTAYNIAMFLTRSTTSQLLQAGDLLVVDEASMVTTGQLTALYRLAANAGAKLLLTGDPAQLPAIGPGGVLAMIARQHGCYQLTQVQRMTQPWERDASLRLRAGDPAVLADYDRYGRLLEGSAEEMETAAYRAWLADHLDGKATLLIAHTTEQAADLSRRARADLFGLGLVHGDGVTLADGNTAGIGDLVQARRNDRDIRDTSGRPAANRDVWRIENIQPGERVTLRRDLGTDPATGQHQWSASLTVPVTYLREHAVLAYATTVHAAEGRTVDTCHALAGEGMSRALLYVAMSRGRDANHAYVITEPRTADIRPGAMAASPAAQQDTRLSGPETAPKPTAGAEPWAPPADRFTVLAAALANDDTDPPALDTIRAELHRASHLAHLGAIWTDLTGRAVAARCDAILSRELSPADYQQYASADARSTLHRQVRAAELAGHDPDQILTRAVRMRPLDDTSSRGRADDVGKVLHFRVRELTARDRPRPVSNAERTPRASDPQIDTYLRELAALMDQRVASLGDQAVADPPAWALEHLGPVPADPARRREWSARAGTVAAYSERYGRTEPDQVIGREPAAPEARADWHAARIALGITREQADIATASTGELWARRARYERDLTWAPPHVADDLRVTALARCEHATQATLLRARVQAAAPGQRAQQLAQAEAHQHLADSLEHREAILTGIDTQRARWHAATAQARASAREATEELRRRIPDADLGPFHVQARDRVWLTEQAPPRTPRHAARTVELELASADLRRAAELAGAARRMLDERGAQAQRAAEMERQRQAEEPSLDRWPHRDPGYDFATRSAELTAARLAARDFRAAVPDLAARRWRELGHEPFSRPSRQAERDEPEAAL